MPKQTLHSKRASIAPPSNLGVVGVRPSKGRGQNFLIQPAVAKRIVDLAELGAGDHVLEIGPGLGMLTEHIASHPISHLTLVELDRRLASRLEELFAGDRRVRAMNLDFIELDLASLGGPLKILGNLPFNSAGAILRRLCEHSRQVARMVLMFQREVGERIRARPATSDYSALSVYTALYFEIESHFRVGAGNFHPRPMVDAEVLAFTPRAELPFDSHEEAAVLATIRASFSAPRKTIRNSLAHGLAIDPARAAEILREAGIDPGARAETLRPATFVVLARSLMRLAPDSVAAHA